MLLKAHLRRRRIVDAAETWSLSTSWSIPCLGLDVLHFRSTWYRKNHWWIQRLNWSPRFIHKASACSSQDITNLEIRRGVPSLTTGPLTQYLHWGDTMIKTMGFPTMSAIWVCWPLWFTQTWEAHLCDLEEHKKQLNINNEAFLYVQVSSWDSKTTNTEKGTATTEEITSLPVGKLTPNYIYSIQLWVHICNAKSCRAQAKNHPHPSFWEWNISALQYRMLRITRAQHKSDVWEIKERT